MPDLLVDVTVREIEGEGVTLFDRWRTTQRTRKPEVTRLVGVVGNVEGIGRKQAAVIVVLRVMGWLSTFWLSTLVSYGFGALAAAGSCASRTQ